VPKVIVTTSMWAELTLGLLSLVHKEIENGLE
jgi:hypothetical protein